MMVEKRNGESNAKRLLGEPTREPYPCGTRQLRHVNLSGRLSNIKLTAFSVEKSGKDNAWWKIFHRRIMALDDVVSKRAHYSPPWADVCIIGIAGSSGSGKNSTP